MKTATTKTKPDLNQHPKHYREKYYLISVNRGGSISYLAEGSYRAMKKLDRHSFHIVTSIGDYDKALRKYGSNY